MLTLAVANGEGNVDDAGDANVFVVGVVAAEAIDEPITFVVGEPNEKPPLAMEPNVFDSTDVMVAGATVGAVTLEANVAASDFGAPNVNDVVGFGSLAADCVVLVPKLIDVDRPSPAGFEPKLNFEFSGELPKLN